MADKPNTTNPSASSLPRVVPLGYAMVKRALRGHRIMNQTFVVMDISL